MTTFKGDLEKENRELTAYELWSWSLTQLSTPKDRTKTSMVERSCTPNPAPKKKTTHKHINELDGFFKKYGSLNFLWKITHKAVQESCRCTFIKTRSWSTKKQLLSVWKWRSSKFHISTINICFFYLSVAFLKKIENSCSWWFRSLFVGFVFFFKPEEMDTLGQCRWGPHFLRSETGGQQATGSATPSLSAKVRTFHGAFRALVFIGRKKKNSKRKKSNATSF